jgi:hypothetical protein
MPSNSVSNGCFAAAGAGAAGVLVAASSGGARSSGIAPNG